nr:hypothetical protein [Rhizorhabdus wittichii]
MVDEGLIGEDVSIPAASCLSLIEGPLGYDRLEGPLASDPVCRRVQHFPAAELAGRPVIHIGADIALGCQDIADHIAVPGPPGSALHLRPVEQLGNSPVGQPTLSGQPIDTFDGCDFVIRARHQNDPVGTIVLHLARLEFAFEGASLVQHDPAEAVWRRASHFEPLGRQSALGLIDLVGQVSAELAGHGSTDILHDRAGEAAVILEQLRAIVNRDPCSTA